MFHSTLVHYPEYSTLFNGCFNSRALSSYSHIDIQNHCLPFFRCFPKGNEWNIRKVLSYNNTIISGYFISKDMLLDNDDNMEIMKSFFQYGNEKVTHWTIRRDILRLFLNPSENLYNQLDNERKSLIQYDHMIGLQLRMGGKLADSPEHYIGIPFSRIDDVISQVKSYIAMKHWENNVQLYISSDSSFIINHIRNKTKDYLPVIESLLYKHGHSLASKNYISVMNKVISDFYYMSLCDYVFVTWPSSMGRMMCYFTDEDKCGQVLNWTSLDKRKKIPR